jgi:hypothetical protein
MHVTAGVDFQTYTKVGDTALTKSANDLESAKS